MFLPLTQAPPAGPWAGTFSDPDFRPPADPPAAGPRPDGGYPADGDLHRMSDDGGPVGPDPARWSDPDWWDDPGEGGTSAGGLAGWPYAAGRHSPAAAGQGRPLVCPDCHAVFAPVAADLSSVRPPPDRGGRRGPGQLTVRCPHCRSLRAVRWDDRRENG